jgi:sulfur carrier protein ThiS
MKVKLIFHGSLKKYNDGHVETVLEFPSGTTVGVLPGRLGVPQEELAFVAVNGSRAPASQTLQDGDEVKFFQWVAGG